jgi:hypothetical protein
MSYIIHNVEQRSAEWKALRLGKLTGSAASDMMTKIKTGESAARRKLRVRLALERLTGRSQESDFLNASMQHGIDTEPMAVCEYEARSGTILEPVGFAELEGLMAGCSPDSFLLDRKGTVSIKCPDSSTHYEYVKSKRIPHDYYWQNVHEMWLLDAEFVDFVSFDDRFPEHLQYLCIRHERDDKVIAEYDAEARRFLAEVSIDVQQMKELTA